MIFPICVSRLRRPIANTRRAAIHPANKIDNSIVNNIECSYHPQKCGIVFLRNTQTAKAAAKREE
jgi:hypothetical protein